ncbi:diacylglycerol/lipid kinase family protein [Microcella humidisoli]|uniref:NAD(+)/NADH kinase n=1 Tax=Microcella humidisoli TaxID=2963406 RepID=A0ABY5FZW3_9MICO|nr:diacylglycerol kinase family protein [Microcella humidisoli]UTT63667.1 NAD(+)/NADH kinase [Microcella humidisoli]
MSTPGAAADPARVAVIVNPTKVDMEALRAAVAAAEEEAGWAPSLWLETSVDDPGQGRAREAIAARVTAVLTAGGDGTVRAVAEGMLDSGIPIVLIPSGTGNLLARNLGLSLGKLSDSLTTAVTGVDQAIDVGIAELTRDDGSVERHAFVVMVGIGLDAKMIAATNPDLKKKVGWLAYVEATARIVRDVDAVRLRYSLDGSPERSTTIHTLLIGNCGSLPGGVLILPDAQIDDGLLDVVAMRPRNLWGWMRVSYAVVWENGVLQKTKVGRRILAADKSVRALRYFQGRRMTLAFERPEEFEIDGEEMGLVTRLEVRVAPASLVVRVPREG